MPDTGFPISFSKLMKHSLHSGIFQHEYATLRAFWIPLNYLLYRKQDFILLPQENLRNALVKIIFPLNNAVEGQVRTAVSFFSVNTD